MSVSGALAEFKLYFSRRPPLDSGGSKKRTMRSRRYRLCRIMDVKSPAGHERLPGRPADKPQFPPVHSAPGLIEHSAEIPLALAWMRYLGLKPKEETQAAALAFFGKCLSSRRWWKRLRVPEKGEYARLRSGWRRGLAKRSLG
ncbi:hypothetical protein BDQ17DRAFT_1338470 [Cyathus striatus]|nr:hypothetical protein BDQ17DRAFT_1338470 [Cyathus striatus]